MSPQEVTAVLNATSLPADRVLMVGVLASTDTLAGRESRWPRRYPNVNDIAGTFPAHPRTLNLVHYNSDAPEFLARQLVQLSRLGGPNLHGYQLNIPWPPAHELVKYRDQCPEMKIVLQINRKAVAQVGGSPDVLVDRLARHYPGLVDYVLLDLSAGYGIPLDTQWARPFLTAIQEADLSVGIGVAGGLSPAMLHLVEPLVGEFPDLSIDAESLLRDSKDDLDVSLARAYIGMALELFRTDIT